MELKMPNGVATRVRMLLKLEFRFTLIPAIVLPLGIVASLFVFPPAAVFFLILAFVYLLPAFLIVNSLGYKTVEGAVPLPVPASSLNGLLLIIVTHAALVAVLYLFYLLFSALTRWSDREIRRVWARLTKPSGRSDPPSDPWS